MDSIGRRNPAIPARTEEWPATTIASLSHSMRPLAVFTARTRPFAVSTPVTAQFWMMCMPMAEQARA